MVAVHQFLPTFTPRDAVGNHTRATQQELRRAGCAGGIWAEHVNPDLLSMAGPYRAFPRRRGKARQRALLHYHASIGTAGLVDFLVERPEPLSIYYHNITPASFFEAYDAMVAGLLRRGREELRRMAPRVRVALAASEYNACELRALGVEDVRVMPPYGEPSLASEPDPEYLRRLREGKRELDLLFVGRVAPHKGHRHLTRVMAALQGAGGTDARLFIVGAPGPRPYMAALRKLIERLGLQERVLLTGSLTEAQLVAHYRTADIYLCLSEPEGFGLPLLEAMRAGVPVVAYNAGAVGETLAGAGVLVGTLDPLLVAEVVVRVGQRDVLRAELSRRQRLRAQELDEFPRSEVLLGAVEALATS
jgi:glycosyltransferase involved in cell wall biosynthesis